MRARAAVRYLLLIVVIAITAAGTGFGQVAVDTSASSQCDETGTTCAVNITVAANSDRMLAACAIGRVGAGGTVSGVSSNVDGAFTTVVSHKDTTFNTFLVHAWRLNNPTAGAHTITGTWNGTYKVYIGVVSFYNVDIAGTPIDGTATTDSNGGASDDITITSEADDMTTACALAGGSLAGNLTSGDTIRWDEFNGTSGDAAAQATAPGAASVVIDFTASAGTLWDIVGFNINAAAAPPAATGKPLCMLLGVC